MVLVQFGFQRPEIVILTVQMTFVSRDLDLAAEELLALALVQRFRHILVLLEADHRIPISALTDHLDHGHLAVLFVLMKQAVLQTGVRGANRQIAHTDRQRFAAGVQVVQRRVIAVLQIVQSIRIVGQQTVRQAVTIVVD